MLSILTGILRLKIDSFEKLFESEDYFNLSLIVLTLSCLSGAFYPFLTYESNLQFSLVQFLVKFIGLLSQNIFIISGLFFLGVMFFANPKRIGIDNGPAKSKELLTFKKHLKLLSFVQIPVILGMISVLPFIRELKMIPGIIIFASTLWLYILITKAIFVSYGYGIDNKTSLQIRYTKAFLVILFTYLPGAIIFQLFIGRLLLGIVELWI